MRLAQHDFTGRSSLGGVCEKQSTVGGRLLSFSHHTIVMISVRVAQWIALFGTRGCEFESHLGRSSF